MDTEVLDRPTVPVTARPKTTADILEAAALVIEEFGWVQGTYGSERGGYCWDGAVMYACGWRGEGHSMGNLDASAYMAARAAGKQVLSVPIDFNDAPGRQQYEVTAALREAAKRARAVTTRSAQDGS